MRWAELFGHLLDFQQSQVMVQVSTRHDGCRHTPVLTAIGTLGGGPLLETAGSDSIALTLTTLAGGSCGAVLLREPDFEDAGRPSERHLLISHGGVDIGLTRADHLTPDAVDGMRGPAAPKT